MVVFWWFLCCVVVGFVWIVVDFLYKICLEVEKMAEKM